MSQTKELTYTEIIGQQTVQIHQLTQQVVALSEENKILHNRLEEKNEKPAQQEAPKTSKKKSK